MFLLIGDLHLTDQARDAYRLDIFNWIRKQQEKYKPVITCLLGDLTDAKDKHSATLVNKIVGGLVSLKPPVYIDRGNHDYKADQSNPFFRFLNHIDGLKFVCEPTVIRAVSKTVALIPHYRSQDEFDSAVHRSSRNVNPDLFLVHQTFEGAIAESGVRLSGLRASPIEALKPQLGIYAGDVHRPQRQGKVTYVGAPYQVRFGDDFEPSCTLLSSERVLHLHFDAPRKWALTVRDPLDILDNSELFEGDQVKLTIELVREEAVDWKIIKDGVLTACKAKRLDVYGAKLEVKTRKRQQRVQIEHQVTPDAVFEQFCKAEGIAVKIKKTGKELLHGN